MQFLFHIEVVLQFQRQEGSVEDFTEDSHKALQIGYHEQRMLAEAAVREACFALVKL